MFNPGWLPRIYQYLKSKFLSGAGTSIDQGIPRFSGTSGAKIKSSYLIATDSGAIQNCHPSFPATRTNTASNDLQIYRSSPTQVANGLFSVICGGQQNTNNSSFGFIGAGSSNVISGDSGVVCGGLGNSVINSSGAIGGGKYNACGGISSVINGGEYNIANGNYSCIPGGKNALAQRLGQFSFAGAFPNSVGNTSGSSQFGLFVLRGRTSDATPFELTLDGLPRDGNNNTIYLDKGNLHVLACNINVAAISTYNPFGNVAYFAANCLVKKNVNTMTLHGVSKNVVYRDNNSWDISISIAGNGLAIFVIGGSQTGIAWTATVTCIEMFGG